MLNYSLWSLEFLVSNRFDSGHTLSCEVKSKTWKWNMLIMKCVIMLMCAFRLP